MDHKHNGMAELVFAAITQSYPMPPPIGDDPPLHVFTMSVGIIMGKLVQEGKFRPQDLVAASNWIAGKKSVQEIIKLIWVR